MLRQSVRPRSGETAKAYSRPSSLQTYVSDCQRIVQKSLSAYDLLLDRVKAASSVHVPSTNLTLHTFADGFLHLVGPRFVTHLLIIAFAATVATVSGISASGMTRGSSFAPWEFQPFAARSFTQARDFLEKPALPFTAKPVQATPESIESREGPAGREGIITYEVLGGDTLSGIAAKFGVTIDTVALANKLDDADFLSVGGKLTILPVSGILHTVRDGETVESLATKYKVEPKVIMESPYNGLSEPYYLFIDQKIIVPGGTMPVVPRPMPVARSGDRPSDPPASAPAAAGPAPKSSGKFAWPTTGMITQGYSGYHPALDIAPPWGAPIYASEAGVVVSVEYLNYGYGWNLVIDHGDGFTTRYSHLSKFSVSQGQRVNKGQVVGANGTTGYATGPHLDFRIYQNGAAVNPLKYLP